MEIPFGAEEFFRVFAEYNRFVWPVQYVLNAAAVLAIALSLRRGSPSRLTAPILGILWAWTGLVYHIGFFRAVNPAAGLFGALFIVQAGVFLIAGSGRDGLAFAFEPSLRGFTGALLMLYGLAVYPLLGHELGHQYPAAPTFGVPCPTAIFTFGMLLWSTGPVRWYYLVIPVLWSVVGFTAALRFGMAEDIGLLVAAMLAVTILRLDRPPGEARIGT